LTPITISFVVLLGLSAAAMLWLVVRARTLGQRTSTLQSRVDALAKYEAIQKAEEYATQLTAAAKAEAQKLTNAANAAAARVRSDADAQAARLLAEASQRASALAAESEANATTAATAASEERKRASAEAAELRARATAIVDEARAEARRIVDEARQKAEAIAGDALEAKDNADRYTQVARAMQNVIEGYGDRYIVPTFSLLDELAEDFGFTEAGAKLKAARERTRAMVKNVTAATCDYVEANRRGFAIDFVVDAFNGKVDSVLASTRQDNFGTLEQKIKDAFTLVNLNGKAFRDARITEEYLDARLQELKWAVVVKELKEKEKEEQRLIRERIREEERAQREYERAMKEAAKEEETLKRLREKVQAEFDQASDAQKAKYEKQLVEVNERLRLAEEKNQRALSMAQQTRAGHVYVISNIGSLGENVYKIGLTRRLDPQDRIKELGDASVPFDFDVHAMIRSEDAPALESALHRLFVNGQVNKVNPRKEFFRVGIHDIRDAVERMGCQASWTLTAAAAEYRESLAIERAMEAKSIDVREWAERQIAGHDAELKKAPEPVG